MSNIFYRAVVQADLLLGAETWVLLQAMYRKLEGIHMGFLKQITGHRSVWQKYGTWRQVAVEKVLERQESSP